MSTDTNKSFIVTKLLTHIGKDIRTTTSKVFRVGEIVTKDVLYKYSADKGMIIELHPNIIFIMDNKKIIHLIAKESK